VCDLETSRMGAPYIYDISSLRFNDLTFILLTWRKWLAPNNASIQQMGFNLGFKGLNPTNCLDTDKRSGTNSRTDMFSTHSTLLVLHRGLRQTDGTKKCLILY